MTAPAINTHNVIVEFGKHRGVPWTRVPVSYLKWLVNAPAPDFGTDWRPYARAELERRGTHTPDIEVSGHAIDRASLNCRAIWHGTREKDEGIHAWLCRMAAEALKVGTEENGKRRHAGMFFAFEMGELYPVLKTVMPAGGAPRANWVGSGNSPPPLPAQPAPPRDPAAGPLPWED